MALVFLPSEHGRNIPSGDGTAGWLIWKRHAVRPVILLQSLSSFPWLIVSREGDTCQTEKTFSLLTASLTHSDLCWEAAALLETSL
ncbi:hypothetical protein LDENG_00023700 [Lucifuga dentata]|nr:hypothetical protein LDENG_00023700 [Lucifuga dentata]